MLSQIIKFSQTSIKIFYCSSFIALAIAIFIFPTWYQVFTPNSQIIPLRVGELELFWNQLVCTVFSTFMSWLWMTILFISTIHLWQGKPNKRFGITSYIICLSITLGGFWMLVFYPAVMSVDALGHWQQALVNKYSLWHPPILAMLMHATQYFVKSPSLFSFIQGSLFWCSILYLVRQVVKNNRLFLINTIFIILLPPLWLYSNATVSNTWMATFTLFAAAFLIRARYRQSRISFFLSILSLSIAVCFRREAVLLVFVPLGIYLSYLSSENRIIKKAGEIALIMAIVIIPAKMIEISPAVIKTIDDSITGHMFINPYIGTLVYSQEEMSETDLNVEKHLIDNKFGAGTFQQLVERYKCSSEVSLRPVMGKISQEEASFIVSRAIQTAINHPAAFIKYKACNFFYFLQIPKVNYQNWGFLREYKEVSDSRKQLGIKFDSRLPLIKDWYIKTLSILLNSPGFSLLFKHYIFLGFSVIFLAIGAIFRKFELMIPSLFSCVYIFGYLLTDSYPLWRYLLVCYLCSWISLITAFNYMILGITRFFFRIAILFEL